MSKPDNPRYVAYTLLENWISDFDLTVALAASVLGVSRRTVDRWREKQRAPRWIARFLEQLQHGPMVKLRVQRGLLSAFRDNDVRRALYGHEWSEVFVKSREGLTYTPRPRLAHLVER